MQQLASFKAVQQLAIYPITGRISKEIAEKNSNLIIWGISEGKSKEVNDEQFKKLSRFWKLYEEFLKSILDRNSWRNDIKNMKF